MFVIVQYTVLWRSCGRCACSLSVIVNVWTRSISAQWYTWPSCLSKISRSNMRFTVELKQSALSTPVFCRRPDSQLFHWGNFDVRASLQKHKISPNRLMLAAFLCVIDDDCFVIISSCSLSTTFAKCTKTSQELLEKHPLREKKHIMKHFLLNIQVVPKTLNVVVVFSVGSLHGTRREW